MALRWRAVSCYRLRAATPVAYRSLDRQSNFTAENFYTISTDTHIDHLVIVLALPLCRTHENAAWTVHFEPLFDLHLLIAGGHTVRDHPGRAAARRRTRRRILSVIKNHARMQPRVGVDGFAADKIQKFSSAARQVFCRARHIDPETLQRLERSHRRNRER